MQNAIKLGQIRGIEIGVHYSWLLIFGLLTWSLAQGFFPANYPGWEATTYWVAGALSALALFMSVLAHELTHSIVAQSRGLPVHSITLFIFGGVSNLQDEPASARDEFLIAIVGPLSSFVLAAAFWGGRLAAGADDSPLAAGFTYLATVNALLAGFNLLPGFPLDGGRVLRSIIWGATGSLRRATEIASYVGQGIGWLMIFWGVSQALGGALLNGLWIAFLGWFLNGAAESNRQAQALKESLRGVRVAQLMDPQPALAGPDTFVQEFVYRYVIQQGRRSLLVVEDGRLLGLVSITDAKDLPQTEWAATPVARIMTPVPLKTVARDSELTDALRLLVAGSLNQLPVVDDGRLVGLLTRADVLRFLQLRQELHLERMPGERSQATA
ncbi:MAG: site-2 protease family protein [Chloroflexota bacterium]